MQKVEHILYISTARICKLVSTFGLVHKEFHVRVYMYSVRDRGSLIQGV